MKFRKKAGIIRATQWFKNGDHPKDGPRDREGQVVRFFRAPDFPTPNCLGCGTPYQGHGFIDTAQGGHRVCPRDWIITLAGGERYPCKPDVFDATYEPVEAEG